MGEGAHASVLGLAIRRLLVTESAGKCAFFFGAVGTCHRARAQSQRLNHHETECFAATAGLG
jgi:hypothetical protein